MDKIHFNALPFDYEYAGRTFSVTKLSRLFDRKRITLVLLGHAVTDSGVDFICLVGDDLTNHVLDSLITPRFDLALDMYLDNLEKYA